MHTDVDHELCFFLTNMSSVMPTDFEHRMSCTSTVVYCRNAELCELWNGTVICLVHTWWCIKKWTISFHFLQHVLYTTHVLKHVYSTWNINQTIVQFSSSPCAAITEASRFPNCPIAQSVESVRYWLTCLSMTSWIGMGVTVNLLTV